MSEIRSIVEQVAKIINPAAWMPLWEPHTETDVLRQKYLQSKALYEAVKILTLAARTPNLTVHLIQYEKDGWRKLGVPVDEPSLAAIVEGKYV